MLAVNYKLKFKLKHKTNNMKELLLASVFNLALIISAIAQNTINSYEYWFDNDFTNKVTTPITPVSQLNVNANIPTTSLADGIHTFNFRALDNDGLSSSVLSEYFYKVPAQITATNKEIIAYEYWFDNDFANAVSVSTTQQQQINISELLTTSGLNDGIHTFNIRFKDNAGLWSSVLSEYFYKVPETTLASNPEIVTYEYWFDNDFANAQEISTAPQQQIILNDLISTTSLNNGIHTLNIRFKDNAELWSSVLSHYFYKVPQQVVLNNLITEYRYWLDQDFQNAVYKPVSPAVQQFQLVDSLDFTMIPKDEYIINFQFKDTTGLWSSVISDTIVKTPLPIPIFSADSSAFCDQGTVTFINNSIDGDEYLWDFGDGNTSTDVEPTHTYAQPGIYNVNLTAYDLSTPIDSTVVENELVIVYETPDATIQIMGNDSICENDEVELMASGTGDYDWSTGENTQSINVDTGGDFWVTVYNTDFATCYNESDTVSITLMPLPYADFDYTHDSLEVTFTNLSEDGDSYHWDFGDGNTSQDVAPIHNYSQSDNYPVYLITTNWCGSDTTDLTVELAFLSLSNYSDKDFDIQLFPNPTNGKATIQMNDVQSHIQLKIYNSIGALIDVVEHRFTDKIDLDMNYQKGTYLIHIFADDFEGVMRLVKQ